MWEPNTRDQYHIAEAWNRGLEEPKEICSQRFNIDLTVQDSLSLRFLEFINSGLLIYSAFIHLRGQWNYWY